MTDTPTPPTDPTAGATPPAPPAAATPPAAPPPPPAPAAAMPTAATANGPLGKIRSPAAVIIFSIITLGIYVFVYWFKTFNELKEHNGTGIGGVLALVLGLFVGFVNPFLEGGEVSETLTRRGQPSPVSWKTGFWVFLPLIGFIIWVVKVQGALNEYWISQGQTKA